MNLDDRVTDRASVGSSHSYADLFTPTPLMKMNEIGRSARVACAPDEPSKQGLAWTSDECVAEPYYVLITAS